MDTSLSSRSAPGAPSRSGTGAVTLIDEMMGAYLIGEGAGMRLHVMGRPFGADDTVPDDAFQGLNRTGNARAFVIAHMVRRFGGDDAHWPLAARAFIHS